MLPPDVTESIVSDYRLYAINPHGRIQAIPLEFQADTDEEAIAHAAPFLDGSDMELWQQGRRVKMFPAVD